jgi:C4-type Zn-finger protein
MTLCDCPSCGRRELRGLRSLHSIPTTRGHVLALTCRRCGAEVSAATNHLLRPGATSLIA